MSERISACIVVHNEAGVIERCLQKLQGVADELVVVHDGEPQDATLEIAKKYGARTFVRPHEGTAEVHRPFSYEQATGEWILQIDADEYLSDELKGSLRQLVEDTAVDGYAFRWPPYDGQRCVGKAFSQEIKYVLLRKSQLYMIGITHEFPKTHGAMSFRPDLLLEHHPAYNNWTLGRVFHKWFAWGRLEAKHIVHLPDYPTFGLEHPEQSWEYGFFAQEIRHPWLVQVKYIKNIWTKVFLWMAKHPGDVFDWMSWKIAILHSINRIYLGWRIWIERGMAGRDSRWWEEVDAA